MDPEKWKNGEVCSYLPVYERTSATGEEKAVKRRKERQRMEKTYSEVFFIFLEFRKGMYGKSGPWENKAEGMTRKN